MVGEDGLIRVDCEFCATSFPIALANARLIGCEISIQRIR